MLFDKSDAQAIAKKLKATFPKKKKHDIAVVSYAGKAIVQFGIRRGSGKLGHDYIPSQIHVTNQQARDLVLCPMSYEDWVSAMKEKHFIIEDTPGPRTAPH
jgi:phosphoenolpyruvate synthase/pyruvate phosphate dikinase